MTEPLTPRSTVRDLATRVNALTEKVDIRTAGPHSLISRGRRYDRPAPHRPVFQSRYFELKDDLTPGGSATALLREWNSGTSQYETGTDEFEVYDVFGEYRGRKKDKYTTPHDAGSRGEAVQNTQNSHWEIKELQPAALMILGQATADFSTATFTIDGVVVLQPIGGLITDQDPAGNITVANLFGYAGSDNDSIVAIWDEANDRYIAIGAQLISVTAMTNFQVDTGTQKLQKKTRALKTLASGAESDWTDVHTGTTCPT